MKQNTSRTHQGTPARNYIIKKENFPSHRLSNRVAGLSCCKSSKVPYFQGDKDVKTNRPIIGILTQDSESFVKLPHHGMSYLAASYVKFLEAAGARVVPIRNTCNLRKKELKKLFNSINGLLFPGGGVDLINSSYAKTGEILFNLAMKANDGGDVFPIWGTCLGFELLHVLASKHEHKPQQCDAENFLIPLNFRKDFKESRMFKSAPSDVIHDLKTRNITLNMHHGCITVKRYNETKSLNKFFRVISTNKDKDNDVEFISSSEARHYPFYGTQWHPEKNQFEWTKAENINHSFEAVRAAQYLASFFVDQARMSNHTFTDAAEERKYLIFQYRPRYCDEKDTNFDECYFFGNKTKLC